MHLNELKAQHVSQLLEMAAGLEIENANRLRKQELMFAIMKKRAKQGEQIFGDGVLEVLPDGFGFLRSPDTSYLASTDDIYISPSQIRRFNLYTGDSIEGEVRTPKDGERYFALVKVDKVNGFAPEAIKHRIMFENLTPLHPDKVMPLERDIKSEENLTGRILDIFAPIGKGQRGHHPVEQSAGPRPPDRRGILPDFRHPRRDHPRLARLRHDSANRHERAHRRPGRTPADQRPGLRRELRARGRARRRRGARGQQRQARRHNGCNDDPVRTLWGVLLLVILASGLIALLRY